MKLYEYAVFKLTVCQCGTNVFPLLFQQDKGIPVNNKTSDTVHRLSSVSDVLLHAKWVRNLIRNGGREMDEIFVC